MTQNRLYDLKSNLDGDVSIAPGTNLSGTTATEGDGFDCLNTEGPVHGLFSNSTATGSPTSYVITCLLQESDDNSTNWTTVPNSNTLTLTATKTQGFIRGHRTKRYVRCKMTPAFTGGSSPTLDVGANVLAVKKSY